MKIIRLSIIICACHLLACQQTMKIKTEKFHTTDQTDRWSIFIKHSICSSNDVSLEKNCTLFNDEIKGLISGIQTVFQEQAKRQIIQLDSLGKKLPIPYELYITDSLFCANDEIISVRIESYQMLGGANGITHFYGINYQVKTQHFLTPKEILNYEKADTINSLLKEYFKDPDRCYTFDSPTLENLTAINLTPNSVEFTYAKYILGPGACGPVTISIPKNKLQGLLKL